MLTPLNRDLIKKAKIVSQDENFVTLGNGKQVPCFTKQATGGMCLRVNRRQMSEAQVLTKMRRLCAWAAKVIDKSVDFHEKNTSWVTKAKDSKGWILHVVSTMDNGVKVSHVQRRVYRASKQALAVGARFSWLESRTSMLVRAWREYSLLLMRLGYKRESFRHPTSTLAKMGYAAEVVRFRQYVPLGTFEVFFIRKNGGLVDQSFEEADSPDWPFGGIRTEYV